MSTYQLTVSSPCDLGYQILEEHKIPYVQFKFIIDDVLHMDDLGKTMPPSEFYDLIRKGKMPTTSQVNSEEYKDFFRPFLDKGLDIVHLDLSSGITGSVASAHIAVEDLKEEYPERQIHILDSLCASAGLGLFIMEMIERYEAGMSMEEIIAWGEENKFYINHWFFATDLTAFFRGGRISKTSHILGTMLKICPLMRVDEEGKLIPTEKARGKKGAKKLALEKMKKHARDGFDYTGKVYISHSSCYEDAKDLADMIEATFPHIEGGVKIFDIGTSIGSHTGIGTVALFFFGDHRKDLV